MSKTYLALIFTILTLNFAAAEDLSLFGVKLGDDVKNYSTGNERKHPYANGYIHSEVAVPLPNSEFESYTLAFNEVSKKVEQIFSEASFGDFDQCKASADFILEILIKKFGRGFEKFEGANGTSYEYSHEKAVRDGRVSVNCVVEQGADTFLWVDLRSDAISESMRESSENF